MAAMNSRSVAAGARRTLQRYAAPCAAAAAPCGHPIQSRGFAAGAHFGGFPFGDQFGGQGPPRGNSDKFYNLLGVDRNATEAEIKSAYKKQAMSHHPDRGGDEGKFKEISRAYEVLSDPQKKQLYDAYGEEGLNNMEQGGGGGAGQQAGQDPFDLFSQMFGFNAGRRGPRGKPRTQDSRYELRLTLEEIYAGTARSINYTREALCEPCDGYGGTERKTCHKCEGTGRQVTFQQMGMFVQQVQSACQTCGSKGYIIPEGKICGKCNGRGTKKEKKTFDVNIEPGVKAGTEYRFKGQADAAPGHDTGDVVIAIQEKPHKLFKRAKDALVMSKKISLTEALCGFEFSVKFLDGKDLVLRSSPGQVVRPGDLVVVEGKGLPRPHGQSPGNLYLHLDVDFPERLEGAAQEKVAEALGGKAVTDEAPLGAECTKRLSRRRQEDLQQQWAQQAQQQRGENCPVQ